MDNHYSFDSVTNTLRVKRLPAPTRNDDHRQDRMGILDANYHGSADLLLKKWGKDWFDLDVFALDRFLDSPMVPFCLHICCDVWSLHHRVNGEPPPIADIIDLVRLARTISEKYSCTNYYHTIIHGMDVAHSMSCLIQTALRSGLFTLESNELLIALLSAIMHDIDHPGVTYDYFYDKDIHNFFKSKNMVSKESPLTDEPIRMSHFHRQSMCLSSKRYLHSLESHQASMAVSTLLCSNLISHLPEQQQRQLCNLMGHLIEATDMSVHESIGEDIARLSALFENGFPPQIRAQERLLLLCFMIKCSDISNPAKKWNYYFAWSRLITAEFFAQGDKERYIRGCLNPNKFVTNFCDRDRVIFEQSQIGFIKFIRNSFEHMDIILQSRLTRRILIRLDRNQQLMMKLRDVKKLRPDAKSQSTKLVVTLMLRGPADSEPAQKLKFCLLLSCRPRNAGVLRKSSKSIWIANEKTPVLY